MIPTPDKLGLYYPSKDLDSTRASLPARSVISGSTALSIATNSISQPTGYWNGGLGFFYGPTTQPELKGKTFHIWKWIKEENRLYITTPLPVLPRTTDKFKIFAGGKYASSQEVFGLLVGGKQPEADETVIGVNITGITIKKASGMLGAGTLTLQYKATGKALSLKMDSGLFGPEIGLTANGTYCVYNNDFSGFLVVEAVVSSLKTSGTHTDTFQLSIPKNVLIPNYEGYETNTGRLVERYHLLAVRNNSETVSDAMTALSFWTVKPEYTQAKASGSWSNNLYGQPGTVTLNTGYENWPERGFWICNLYSSRKALYYVQYRNGATLYLAPRSDGFFLFSSGNTNLQKGAVIQWGSSGTASTTQGTLTVTRVEVASGSLEEGNARGICYFTRATGTGTTCGMTSNSDSGYCYVSGTSTVVCRNGAGQNSFMYRGWRPPFEVSAANHGNLSSLINANYDKTISYGDTLEVWPDFDLGIVPSIGLHADPPDEYTPPEGVSFQPYVDAENPYIHDILLGGDELSLWIRQTIVDGTQARENVVGNIRALWY